MAGITFMEVIPSSARQSSSGTPSKSEDNKSEDDNGDGDSPSPKRSPGQIHVTVAHASPSGDEEKIVAETMKKMLSEKDDSDMQGGEDVEEK
jgi:hypothetical protein